MAKKTAPTAKQIAQFRQEILDIMKQIADDILAESKNGAYSQYGNQRDIISRVFQCGGYTRGDIIMRLAILDEFYSTNLDRRYFGFDEMADAILSLGSRQAARNYFYSIACGAKDNQKLFSRTYGIHKNGTPFAVATSLMSKYAYFELLQDNKNYPLGFPIYDSLVQDIYPKVCAKLGITRKMKNNAKGNVDIEEYVDCLNKLRVVIFDNNKSLFNGFQQFDILDAYLWRMGKFDVGNLSILLSKSDYFKLIQNIKPETVPDLADSKSKYNDFNFKVFVKLVEIKQPFINCECESFLGNLHQHWLKNYYPYSGKNKYDKFMQLLKQQSDNQN